MQGSRATGHFYTALRLPLAFSMTGYATDPIENEITEFLPDLAKRIHIHVIFVQRVLNQVASDQYSLP